MQRRWWPARGSLQVIADQIRTALFIAFSPRYAYPVGVLGGSGNAGAVGLERWLRGVLFPAYRWDFYATPQESVTIIILALLFGLLLPLQVAAVAKARSAAGTITGGVLGTVFGVLSMSCCAPLILPALLSFVGFLRYDAVTGQRRRTRLGDAANDCQHLLHAVGNRAGVAHRLPPRARSSAVRTWITPSTGNRKPPHRWRRQP